MNTNIRLGNLFGIPFYVNPSWFLVLGLVTWSYGSGLAAFPSLNGSLPWLLGLLTALLLFASVLAHELGHSVVALQQGIGVKSITLFLFGGLANLEKESDTPLGAFNVAIAGPLVSLLLFGLLSAILAIAPLSGPTAAIVGLLASINLALAAFNLIPGLPLDGGNVLKAAIWKLTGNPYRGVRVASRVGQFIGWTAVTFGLLSVLGLSSVGSVWTLLIGWFLLQNASQSAQSAKLQEQLSGFTAADAVAADSPTISAEATLRELADELVLTGNRWRRFVATDEIGRLVGSISVNDLKALPSTVWPYTQVKDIVQPIDREAIVSSKQPLLDVVQRLEQQQRSELLVESSDGILLGLLEKTSIQQLLSRPAQVHLA